VIVSLILDRDLGNQTDRIVIKEESQHWKKEINQNSISLIKLKNPMRIILLMIHQVHPLSFC